MRLWCPATLLQIFFTPSHTKNLRGNRYKLFKKTCNLQLRNSFFSQRVVNDWNNLPDTVVSAPTVNSFKNRLDKFLKNERWNNSEGWCRWFHYPTSTSTSNPKKTKDKQFITYYVIYCHLVCTGKDRQWFPKKKKKIFSKFMYGFYVFVTHYG